MLRHPTTPEQFTTESTPRSQQTVEQIRGKAKQEIDHLPRDPDAASGPPGTPPSSSHLRPTTTTHGKAESSLSQSDPRTTKPPANGKQLRG